MSADETKAGLEAELEAYKRRGLADRAKAVEAELKARGYATPQDRRAPDGETTAPRKRRTKE